jgi:guanylate kinase
MKTGSKVTIGSVATVLAVVSGIWAMEDRYVNAQEMQQSISQVHLRIDVEKKRTLEREYYEFLKLVAQNPENEDLKEHLQAIKEEKEGLEKRIDERLENN